MSTWIQLLMCNLSAKQKCYLSAKQNGRKFGVCECQIRCEILFRELAKIISLWRQIWLQERYLLKMFVTTIINFLKIQCMHFGNVLVSHLSMIQILWDFQRTSIFNSFVDLFKFIIDRGKNLELLAILVFTIRNRINLLHASDKSFPITQVLPNTVSAHVDFLHTLLDDLPTLNPCVSFRAMWIPSPHPMFKVNFDAWFSDFDYS